MIFYSLFTILISENNFAQDERVLEAIQWVDRDRFAKDGYIDSPHNFGTNSIVERPSYVSSCSIWYLVICLGKGSKSIFQTYGIVSGNKGIHFLPFYQFYLISHLREVGMGPSSALSAKASDSLSRRPDQVLRRPVSEFLATIFG